MTRANAARTLAGSAKARPISEWIGKRQRGRGEFVLTPDLFAIRRDDGTQGARDRVHMDAQSLSFYVDISHFLCERLLNSERPLSLLDIGPRTGAGLAILRLLHHPMSYAGLKLDPVTGIDIDPMFRDAAVKSFPDIRALCGDAFALTEGKWDIVLSSHTIEHVDDPADFLKRMEERASRYVVVACPYEEEDLIVWHKNRISYKLLSALGFHDMHVYRSNHWFNSLCVIAAKRVG